MSSIFLSHNSNDKPFVRKLANDLRRNGFYVWVDEAEIKLGDSLIEKIREGIDKVAYVGVVLSTNSINSEWVKREIDIAMNEEIEGKKVKVLPIMLEKVDPPSFLKGKLYADFTSEDSYKNGLELIIARLSEIQDDSQKLQMNKNEVEYYKQLLEATKEELNVSRGEKRLLLERLEKERRNIPEELQRSIESEEKSHPEYKEVNRLYAFMCGSIPVTAGYVLHAIRKERMKGGHHQLAMFAHINGQTDELALIIEALGRRLNQEN